MPTWLQKLHQRGIHVFVLIRNAENDYALIFKGPAMASTQFVAVHGLHHNDDIGPFDQVIGQRLIHIEICASGERVDTGKVGEDMLGGGAAQLVLATHKQIV